MTDDGGSRGVGRTLGLRVRDVVDVLPEYACTTVATVLDRLVHKGLVHRRIQRRTVLFTGVGTPGAHTAVLMH